MTGIDTDKVLALFLRLSGYPKERRNEFDEIVENAVEYISRRVKNASESDMTRIELACAAVAIYDNTVLKLANDKSLCTIDGKQMVNYKDTEQYKYAYCFRSNALAAISDICEDSTFAFAAIEG